MATAGDIKSGSVMRYKNDIWVVSEFQFVNPGKGSAFVRTKMKNVKTGKVVENTFKSNETVDFVEMDRKSIQFTYGDSDKMTFMDMKTYDEITIPKELIGSKVGLIKEGVELDGWFFEGACLSINLPKKVKLTVTEAPPAVKGDSSSGNVTKEVTLETGMKVQAPIFIKVGDILVLSTDDSKYVERYKQ